LTTSWTATAPGATPASIAAALKPYKVNPSQVWGTDPDTGEGRNRRGYHRDTITTAWLATRKDRGHPDGGGDAA
jgi:S-DNA-T family DNA segregation ATPase FtsK/SpoIIIE